MLESDQSILEAEASDCLKNIRKSDLELEQKTALEDVFLSWLMQRFKNLTKKEIRTMFGFDTPVEETVFYKEVFQEGVTEGEIKGKIEGEIKGKIKLIDEHISLFSRLHDQKSLTDDAYHLEVDKLREERRTLQAELDRLESDD